VKEANEIISLCWTSFPVWWQCRYIEEIYGALFFSNQAEPELVMHKWKIFFAKLKGNARAPSGTRGVQESTDTRVLLLETAPIAP